MKMFQSDLKCYEAFRFLVRQAALEQLERMNSRGSRLKSKLALKPWQEWTREESSFHQDFRMAEEHCRAMGQEFESEFLSQLDSEVQRLQQTGQAIRATVSPTGRLGWLRKVRLTSWLIGVSCFLPAIAVCCWALSKFTHKFAGAVELTAVAAIACVALGALTLPVVLTIEEAKRKKEGVCYATIFRQ